MLIWIINIQCHFTNVKTCKNTVGGGTQPNLERPRRKGEFLAVLQTEESCRVVDLRREVSSKVWWQQHQRPRCQTFSDRYRGWRSPASGDCRSLDGVCWWSWSDRIWCEWIERFTILTPNKWKLQATLMVLRHLFATAAPTPVNVPRHLPTPCDAPRRDEEEACISTLFWTQLECVLLGMC